ncbi:MAG: ATP-dependent Clp protease ATP-binding subunit, partial [Bacteroidaceae bacterium]|nr:ATP-dependent Clp protease ATP-binding subunit [Bacteroidaceae bacterium]
MNNQFSQRVSEIISYSKEEANRLRNKYIGPEHLLLGILRDGEGKAIDILTNFHTDLRQLKGKLEGYLMQAQDTTLAPDADIPFSETAQKILKMCILEARLLKSPKVDSEHLLLAILKHRTNLAATVLMDNQMDYEDVFNMLSLKPSSPMDGMDFDEEDADDEMNENFGNSPKSPNSSVNFAQKQGKKLATDTPALDKFGSDITLAAAEGRLDPVVGREREIERVAQILSRRKKNNPILIGEPGVGKSAIVEGLALRIVEKKVSRILHDKRVVMLDMSSVVAGTKYRGQFEERLHAIINELEKNPKIILFIDEIHTIIGAGSAAGSMDAANMLKPALARGEIQCIGATTIDEYRKSIEKDGALERRFQKVMVEPTTADETLQILRNIKGKYEEHHNVTYTDAALEACVKLTDRYISDRSFPDKAIDALDESGSRVHLTHIEAPKEIEEQERLIAETSAQKTLAVKQQNFELAAGYRDREKLLISQLQDMQAAWEAQ